MGIQLQISWKVLLVGDHCIDIYHYGVCERLSPEAPVPILKQTKMEKKMGMSSNVMMNLESFNIKVRHFRNSYALEKHRIIDSRFNQHMMRFDIGDDKPLKPLNKKMVQNPSADVLVISDYNKGFVTREVAEHLCEVYKDKPVFVDSKKKDLSCYSNCYIKINEKEFKELEKMATGCDFIVTLGNRGALYNNKVYPTTKTEVFDVCGAGDVFLSSLVYGFLEYNNMPDAIRLANRCASVSVSRMGTHVLTKDEISEVLNG